MILGVTNIVKKEIDLDFEIWRRRVLAVGWGFQEFKRNCKKKIYTTKEEKMLKKKFDDAYEVLHQEDPTIDPRLKQAFDKLFRNV